MTAEYQLVSIVQLKSGKIEYTFTHRARLRFPENHPVYTASKSHRITLDHPRKDWQISAWLSEAEITAPEGK